MSRYLITIDKVTTRSGKVRFVGFVHTAGDVFKGKTRPQRDESFAYAKALGVRAAIEAAEAAPRAVPSYEIYWEAKDGACSRSIFEGRSPAEAEANAERTLRRRPEFNRVVRVNLIEAKGA